jgi:hypothetical protein
VPPPGSHIQPGPLWLLWQESSHAPIILLRIFARIKGGICRALFQLWSERIARSRTWRIWRCLTSCTPPGSHRSPLVVGVIRHARSSHASQQTIPPFASGRRHPKQQRCRRAGQRVRRMRGLPCRSRRRSWSVASHMASSARRFPEAPAWPSGVAPGGAGSGRICYSCEPVELATRIATQPDRNRSNRPLPVATGATLKATDFLTSRHWPA